MVAQDLESTEFHHDSYQDESLYISCHCCSTKRRKIKWGKNASKTLQLNLRVNKICCRILYLLQIYFAYHMA